LKINNKTTIEYLIERAKRSRRAELIVLCTTHLKEDDVLCEIAKRHGIECFRGPVEDKLMRWLQAVEKFDIEFFVTADGDDLFCEPELIDLAFEQYEKHQPDFIESEGLICGAFSYAIKASALRKVCEIKDTDDTEMMWVYFTKTGLFKTETLQNVPAIFERPNVRMTLDYEDDFRFFEKIIMHFAGRKDNFCLRDILEFLDNNPEIIKINQHRQQQFLDRQQSKTKLIIKQG